MYLSCCSCSPTSVYFLLKLFSFPTLILTSYAGQLGSSLFHHFKLFAPARLQNGRCLVDIHSDDKYMYLTIGENRLALKSKFTSETKCAGQIIKHALAVEGQQTSFHRDSSSLPGAPITIFVIDQGPSSWGQYTEIGSWDEPKSSF